jgi:proline dehydrogenase
VKGAYIGDTTDFVLIQDMYKKCFKFLFDAGQYFSVCTHDPELIAWVKDQADGQKDIFEFGFLKGLGDETKLELIRDGWLVSEYVPFGEDTRAYVKRRERYLKVLEAAGRVPIS